MKFLVHYLEYLEVYNSNANHSFAIICIMQDFKKCEAWDNGGEEVHPTFAANIAYENDREMRVLWKKEVCNWGDSLD